jgi:histidinol-phosphatase (PHP family)
MRTDMHIHSKYSDDSLTTIQEICEEAIKQNLTYACVTDHIHCNPRTCGFEYYDIDGFFKDFNQNKQRYPQLNLLSGIEFGEPYQYPEIFMKLYSLDYDFILGAIHFWAGDIYASELVQTNLSIEDSYAMYYQEIYKMVEFGYINSVAHFDFPKRYYNRLTIQRQIIEKTFKLMVKKAIALEINTSTLRQGRNDSMPDDEILKIYAKCGGKLITVGSDAHYQRNVGEGLDYAKALIKKYGFQEVVFVKKKMILID